MKFLRLEVFSLWRIHPTFGDLYTLQSLSYNLAIQYYSTEYKHRTSITVHSLLEKTLEME